MAVSLFEALFMKMKQQEEDRMYVAGASSSMGRRYSKEYLTKVGKEFGVGGGENS